MKKVNSYYFSVEGENEQWYFEHLQKLINSSNEAVFNVKFNIKKDKSPLSRIKSITIPVYANQKLPVFHIVDYESNDSEHATQFSNLLDELKTIRNKRSAYKYKLGYSNFAFELWLILHKRICNFSVEDRSKYVQNINTLYGTDFTKLKDNKNKETFDKLLNQTTLENVKVAIRNSRKIRIYQEEIGNSMIEYKGFKYYKDNPDLTINECVEIIFSECGINFD